MVHWGRWRVEGILAVSRYAIQTDLFAIHDLLLHSAHSVRVWVRIYTLFYLCVVDMLLYTVACNHYETLNGSNLVNRLLNSAIGDVTLQPYITCEPEIIEKQIEPDDEYLVLASDGVFDVIENEDVAKIVLRNARDFLNVSKRLCTEAIIMGSTDNVTALVIDLK